MNGSKAKAGDSSVEEERNRQLRQGYRDMIEDVERKSITICRHDGSIALLISLFIMLTSA